MKPTIITYSWRAIEAQAHQLANDNPTRFFRVWIENRENEYSAEVTLHASSRGQLTDQSISALRGAKQIVDGGEDFDGCRCYTIEFLEFDLKATRVRVANLWEVSK